ncbi:MAG: hypothetical protein AAF813_03595 [Pseudomonadota bacterium]
MQPQTLSRPERLLFAVPVLGWMLKDVAYGDPDNIWYFVATLVSCWIMSAMFFGLPGLVLPALVMAPLILVVLILMLNHGVVATDKD